MSSALHLLPVPVLELVLARLPIQSALAASRTCKLLYTTIRASKYMALLQHTLMPANRAPWLFFLGINHILPQKNQLFTFSPSSQTWLRLPFPSLPVHNDASLSSGNGALFALSGACQDKLCFSDCPVTSPAWRVTPQLRYSRSSPLVSIFRDPTRAATPTVIVAAGVDSEGPDRLAVEIMNDEDWETYEPMPAWILDEHVGGGSKLQSATRSRRLYVADCHSSRLCILDDVTARDDRGWRRAVCERPADVLFWHPVGCEAALVMVALCWNHSQGSCVKILKVEDNGGPQLGARVVLGTMPGPLFEALFDEDEEETGVKTKTLQCTGGGNLVYVYSDSPFKEYAMCACDIGTGVWTAVPSLPPPVSRFDRVICASTPVTLATL